MEGSLYELFGVTKELGPPLQQQYDPYSLFNTQQQQTTPNNISGVYHNEESLDFTELVERVEKSNNISPLSGSTRSSTGSFLDPEPSFTFENLLPDLNMYSTSTVSPFATTTSLPLTTFSPPQQHHLSVTSTLHATSTNNSIFSSPPPVLSPASLSHQHMSPATPLSLSTTTIHSKTPPARSTINNKMSKKAYDKNSEEYKDRRERNNVAVRKSRNKSKQRAFETEVRVKELEDENVALQNKIALLMKELNVLKNLFSSADQSSTTATHVPLVVKSEANNNTCLTNYSS